MKNRWDYLHRVGWGILPTLREGHACARHLVVARHREQLPPLLMLPGCC